MDLDPLNNKICLLFEYRLDKEHLIILKEDFDKFSEVERTKDTPRGIDYYLNENHSKYFEICRKTVDVNDSLKYIDLDEAKISIKDVINFKYIKANRDVSNKEPDKSLSNLSSKIYNKLETDDNHQNEIDHFKDELCNTDKSLDTIYEELFRETINKVKKFGGIKPDDTKIKITSTLQHKELLKGNTTVMYLHGDTELPENYNGLGYMNLISMIFEIEVLLNEFRRSKSMVPADVNILFIEEPEAHTHPQMQYVFINNIKELLKDGIVREDGIERELQYIISTHSSHIVAESDFNDIKYFKRSGNSVTAKKLMDLENEYARNEEEKNYKFLKQYLTLHRAELFFADKAIFIEGDTERILLPAIMKKLDLESPDSALLSQNISIIEVGNYSHIFEKFIDFIGIKSLIITDIDSAMTTEKHVELKVSNPKIKQKVKVEDVNAYISTNAALVFFYGTNLLSDYINKSIEDLVLTKSIQEGSDEKAWIVDRDGLLACVYQTQEVNSDGVTYHASSFEDSFFHLNRKFIIENKDKFASLKNLAYFEEKSENGFSRDAYMLAEKCVGKKPALAIEILLNSDDNFSNWQIPEYIKRGLLWLKD